MTKTDPLPDAPAEDLVREIERQCDAECRDILAAAELAARAVVRDAFAAATRQVHDTIEDLRRDGERRLARASAQIATELRVRDQALAAGNLRDGCPMLVHAVAERWNDPAARRVWAVRLADEALRRLRPGPWIVEHPQDWPEVEHAALLDRLPPEARAAVTFRPCSDVDAGLRIRAGGATLDATPERLLADKPAVQAFLLAGIARLRAPGSNPPETEGERP